MISIFRSSLSIHRLFCALIWNDFFVYSVPSLTKRLWLICTHGTTLHGKCCLVTSICVVMRNINPITVIAALFPNILKDRQNCSLSTFIHLSFTNNRNGQSSLQFICCSPPPLSYFINNLFSPTVIVLSAHKYQS